MNATDFLVICKQGQTDITLGWIPLILYVTEDDVVKKVTFWLSYFHNVRIISDVICITRLALCDKPWFFFLLAIRRRHTLYTTYKVHLGFQKILVWRFLNDVLYTPHIKYFLVFKNLFGSRWFQISQKMELLNNKYGWSKNRITVQGT